MNLFSIRYSGDLHEYLERFYVRNIINAHAIFPHNSHPIRNFTQHVEFWPLSATFAAD
jgi:hypothetical protein